MFEYVIWGKKPNEALEGLLLTAINGEPIKDKATAEKALKWLSDKHDCTDLRIQEIVFDNSANVQKMFANSVTI